MSEKNTLTAIEDLRSRGLISEEDSEALKKGARVLERMKEEKEKRERQRLKVDVFSVARCIRDMVEEGRPWEALAVLDNFSGVTAAAIFSQAYALLLPDDDRDFSNEVDRKGDERLSDSERDKGMEVIKSQLER